MLDKILKFIERNRMIEDGDHIFAGVSGGADSVCLLLVLMEMQKKVDFSVTAVHVNHGIRGEEALRDETFTKELCSRLGVFLECFCVDVPLLAEKCKMSLEEAGRKARYDILNNLSASVPKAKIAVAHHMDDQGETVLMNIFRGSGIKGMCGMQPVRGSIIRPLLCVRRNEIETYLLDKSQNYVTDSSNLENDYLRNRLRNVVLPYIEENINARAVENISAMAEFTWMAEDYIVRQAQKAEVDCTYIQDGNYFIQLEKFSFLDDIIKRYIVRDILGKLAGKVKDIYRIHIDAVLDLEKKNVGNHSDLAYRMKADRSYEFIRVWRECEGFNEGKNSLSRIGRKSVGKNNSVSGNQIQEFQTAIVLKELEVGNKILIPMSGVWYIGNRLKRLTGAEVYILEHSSSGDININNCEKIIGNNYTKMFDYDKIYFALNIRARKTGDVIQINKNGGTKKLKDYFIDNKIPAEYRSRIPILANGNEVLWILGQRISERYKATGESTRILKISIHTEDL